MVTALNGSGVELMPDLPGKVHGIKSLDPCIVQCDGCGMTKTGGRVGITVLTSGIIFNTRTPDKDHRRMCAGCWEAFGWVEDYRGWRQVEMG